MDAVVEKQTSFIVKLTPVQTGLPVLCSGVCKNNEVMAKEFN